MLVLELLKQVNRRSYPFATLELRKNLGQVRHAKTSGIVTGDASLANFFQSQKSLQKLTWPSFRLVSKVANGLLYNEMTTMFWW